MDSHLDNIDLTAKFFQTKGLINPEVMNIINKTQNDKEAHHHINSLAHNEGIAIWDQATSFYKTQNQYLDSSKWNANTVIGKFFNAATNYYLNVYKDNSNKRGWLTKWQWPQF